VSTRLLFSAIGVAALAVGALLWALAPAGGPGLTGISAAALYSASFRAEDGSMRSLGSFQGQVVVLNFWATWCAPCRAEMPAFSRLQARYGDRGVRFVGLSSDEPTKVRDFTREVPVRYPLWTGGDEVGELSRRLGNEMGVLPHTVLIDPAGQLIESKVGPYTEAALASRLDSIADNKR
jgi:thiol-disulfide isomerase/thioredoxin